MIRGLAMRGSDERSGSLFSYVDLEARVRVDHPLRLIRDLANAALGDLSGEFGDDVGADDRAASGMSAIWG